MFLAPGLLAATAMQSASFEATFPIMGGLVWMRTYHAMYATPITPRDIALGNLAWIAARLTLITSIFTLVIIAFGAAESPTIVLAVPAAVLTGMAFAGPIAAFAATQKTPSKFASIFRFGITPLFLFSGTFFPISSLPDALQALAWLTPLFHGVALTRALSLGTVTDEPVAMVIHVVYLVTLASVGRLPDGAHHRSSAGARMSALRVLPLGTFGSRRSLRLIERNLYIYKHGWLMLLSGFFEPLFYLLGIGFGLGSLIGTIPGPDGQPISYQLFVAPALLASAAMNGAITESTFNFFFKLNYNKTFTSILSTPLGRRHRPGRARLGADPRRAVRDRIPRRDARPRPVRVAVVIFVPAAALLIGFAFGAVGMAATTFMKTWQDFDLIQLVVLPMFLFSGTFYPIEGYPPPLQAFVRITPLYQGVDLVRSLTVGAISPILLVHIAYLAIMGIVGLAIASRRIDKLLLT